MSRRQIRSLLVLFALLLAASLIGASPDPERASLEARAIQVLDGDTIVLRGGERVRYLGIDAPETGDPFAAEAKQLNQSLVRFRDIRLEFDERERDDYGRLLAHVYVRVDDRWVLVNLEIVRAGLARLLFIPPNERYREEYERALHEAVISRRGLWGTISGVLDVWDLEVDPVSFIGEVVTVALTVAEVSVRPGGVILRPGEAKIGFHIWIPSETAGRFAPLPAPGDRIEVTGVFGCPSVAVGLRIPVSEPDQITPAAEGE